VSYYRHKKRIAEPGVYLKNAYFSSIIGGKLHLLAGHVKYPFQEGTFSLSPPQSFPNRHPSD
jgi:hypothetical protein